MLEKRFLMYQGKKFRKLCTEQYFHVVKDAYFIQHILSWLFGKTDI